MPEACKLRDITCANARFVSAGSRSGDEVRYTAHMIGTNLSSNYLAKRSLEWPVGA